MVLGNSDIKTIDNDSTTKHDIQNDDCLCNERIRHVYRYW